MTSGDSAELTTLLREWRAGSLDAGNQLMTAAHDNLRRLAAHYLQGERRDATVQATELVSELYVKLFSSGAVAWQDRAHFFAVAGRQLRRILVDHARARRAAKRGGDQARVSLTQIQGLAQPVALDVLEVDEALCRLELLDARAAAGVELRFFSGLTEDEIAEILGISAPTVRRDWKLARAWLVSQLASDPSKPAR
jgi:RNA polymerase sigma factor (TIGR02999 family)